ncbi:MoaD/ThiS family protein [Shumkonia mesophila]|uniref:MoaD/ThiS family protein n=1 Tax=Shumkonia mesophila TaxID=2838854 RepID=UPI002934456D|nr:MoaD/ThiS family protein [Shumkonia mesophila]
MSAAPVIVRLPDALLALFPGAPRRLEIAAATVGEAIEGLDRRWPGMRDRLCDSTPAIRRHINVFVEGERATLETRIQPGAEVFVLTAISGGRPPADGRA